MHDVVVDPEFRSLCPPLAARQKKLLEESLVLEGCRDALVVWPVGNLLLDGHHRLEICTRRGIAYKVVRVELSTRDAALRWIVRHQLARRNLNLFERIELVLHLEEGLRKEARRRQGRRTDLRGDAAPSLDVRREMAQLADVGASTYSTVKEIHARADAALLARLRRGEVSIHQAYLALRQGARAAVRHAGREANRALVERAATLDEAFAAGARFATVLADPPWPCDEEEEGEGYLGVGRPPYAVMTLEAIAAVPVARFADEHCHLYLWTTNRNLRAAFDVLDAWDFRYVTCLTWGKPHYGVGRDFRGQTEHCLFARRGAQPLLRRDVGTLFLAKRGPRGHSSKPPAFHDLVERCSPGPYLELFARGGRAGWSSWGAEASTAKDVGPGLRMVSGAESPGRRPA